jgi:hypothetical protein
MSVLDTLPEDLGQRQTALRTALKILLDQPHSDERTEQTLLLSEALRKTSRDIIAQSRDARRKAKLRAEANRLMHQKAEAEGWSFNDTIARQLDDIRTAFGSGEPQTKAVIQEQTAEADVTSAPMQKSA